MDTEFEYCILHALVRVQEIQAYWNRSLDFLMQGLTEVRLHNENLFGNLKELTLMSSTIFKQLTY